LIKNKKEEARYAIQFQSNRPEQEGNKHHAGKKQYPHAQTSGTAESIHPGETAAGRICAAANANRPTTVAAPAASAAIKAATTTSTPAAVVAATSAAMATEHPQLNLGSAG
jgi:hypothetical protein